MWLHLITIVLIILKSLGYITFGWWLVFLPSIIVVAIAFVVLGVLLLASLNPRTKFILTKKGE